MHEQPIRYRRGECPDLDDPHADASRHVAVGDPPGATVTPVSGDAVRAEHRCVDCRALPKRPTPLDSHGMSVEEMAAAYDHWSRAHPRPTSGYRPLRPRRLDRRSEPPRCYSHLAQARREGKPIYATAAEGDR